MQNSDEIRFTTEQLKTVGDPVRMRILRILASKELSVGDVTKVLDFTATHRVAKIS